MNDVRGKRVLVVGLARTGRAVVRCFQRRGAGVTVTDSRPPWAFDADVRELMAQKVSVELGLHRQETFLRQDLIVVSPGVRPDLPELEAARRQNIPVVPEVEAASWFLDANLVGITGSNGKTTTTMLLGKMLEASGFRTFVGGNIGVPLISAVDQVPRDSIVVTELSSFQLETVQNFRPRVAVLLNLTPNHLDRHPSFEAYVRAKAQIFRNQTAQDFAVLNADDPTVMSLAPAIASRKIFFSRKQNLPEGVLGSNGHILFRVGNLERELLETREVPLRGEFNLENVLAAAAVACALGADFEALRRAVREFPGVEHRLEYVREIDGVKFYNDSKATSVDATLKALSAFDRGVQLILGGKDKGAPYGPLRVVLEGRVRRVYLIGTAAERIGHELRGAAELVHSGDLETAVRRAFKQADPGDVVLLSPACASFDQFQDFEHRGRVFKELVEQLARKAEIVDAERQKEEAGLTSAPAAPEPVPEPEPLHPQAIGASSEDVQTGTSEPEVVTRRVSPLEPTADLAAGETELLVAEPTSDQAATSELVALEAGDESEPTAARQATESSHATEEQPAASGLPPTVKRPELVYVYEVGAEEIIYPATEPGSEPPEDEPEVRLGEDMRTPEELDDEALPFEVRPPVRASALATSVGGTDGSGVGDQPASDPEVGLSPEPWKGQGRLPGI